MFGCRNKVAIRNPTRVVRDCQNRKSDGDPASPRLEKAIVCARLKTIAGQLRFGTTPQVSHNHAGRRSRRQMVTRFLFLARPQSMQCE